MDTVRYASANKWVKLQCPVYSSLHFALSTATRAKNRSVWKRCRACRPSQFGKCTLQNKFNVIMKLMKKAGDELICGLDISLQRCEYASRLQSGLIYDVTIYDLWQHWLIVSGWLSWRHQWLCTKRADTCHVTWSQYAAGVTEMTSHLRPEVVIGSWREGGRKIIAVSLCLSGCVCVCVWQQIMMTSRRMQRQCMEHHVMLLF